MTAKADDAYIPPFCLTPSMQMEEFSRAFIHAISSVAGFSVESPRLDLNSVDLRIVQRGTQNSFPITEGLGVQAKCTYAHKPKNGILSYPLPVKNYNELRHRTSEPRILVIVHIPDNVEEWLSQTDEFIALHHCGYWMSLLDFPDTTNTNNVTVHIPTNQKITVDELKRIMDILAKAERPVL